MDTGSGLSAYRSSYIVRDDLLAVSDRGAKVDAQQRAEKALTDPHRPQEAPQRPAPRLVGVPAPLPVAQSCQG